jgi:hypothetical protein
MWERIGESMKMQQANEELVVEKAFDARKEAARERQRKHQAKLAQQEIANGLRESTTGKIIKKVG